MIQLNFTAVYLFRTVFFWVNCSVASNQKTLCKIKVSIFDAGRLTGTFDGQTYTHTNPYKCVRSPFLDEKRGNTQRNAMKIGEGENPFGCFLLFGHICVWHICLLEYSHILQQALTRYFVYQYNCMLFGCHIAAAAAVVVVATISAGQHFAVEYWIRT